MPKQLASVHYHTKCLFSNFKIYMMAKIPEARFVMEVAPPQFVSVVRRPLRKLLATINEEEREERASDIPVAE